RNAQQEGLEALCIVDVDASGLWEVEAIPFQSGRTYVFELTGHGIASAIQEAAPSGPGDHMRIDFSIVAPVAVEIRATGTQGEPIDGAMIRAWRQVGELWTQTVAYTNGQGVTLAYFPDGAFLTMRCMKAGYSTQSFGPFRVPYNTKVGVDLVVPRTTKLVGRCLRAGEPLRDFDVMLSADGQNDFLAHSFRGAEDGSFEIDDVPAGGVLVYSSADHLTNSVVHQVQSVAGETARLEINLPAPAQAKGFVIDAFTGETLNGVAIQAVFTSHRQTLGQIGHVAYSAADGSFDGPDLNPLEGAISVSAPGYVTAFTPPIVAADGIADFGRVQLSPTRDLIVRFTGPEHRILNTMVEIDQVRQLRSVPADGVVVFRDLRPDTYTLVYHPYEGSRAFWRTLRLMRVEHGDWDVEVSLDGGHELHVEVEGSDLPESLWVCVTCQDALGQQSKHWADMYRDGDADFFDLEGDQLGVEVFDLKMNRLTAESFDFSAGYQSPIRIEILDADHSLRIVDGAGDAVPNVIVFVHSAGSAANWWIDAAGDQDGLVRLAALPNASYQAFIRRGTVTTGPHSFTLSGEASETTLVLDTDASLKVRASAGGVALQGFECQLYDTANYFYLGRMIGDSRGLATLADIQAGSYVVRIIAPGIFIGPYAVEVRPEATVNNIACRLFGELSIHAVDGGTPLAGAQVRLMCAAAGTDVERWMQLGTIAANAMTLDSSGRLRIAELPEGEFDYRLWTTTGVTFEGRVHVRGNAHNELSLRAEN
ncbi:MAG: hypothetical protein ACI841_001557, partial [Planctomycetota bacterium]